MEEHKLILRVLVALGLLRVGAGVDRLQLLPDHLGHGSVERHLPAHGHQLLMHNIC
jgi:hypothetical protein